MVNALVDIHESAIHIGINCPLNSILYNEISRNGTGSGVGIKLESENCTIQGNKISYCHIPIEVVNTAQKCFLIGNTMNHNTGPVSLAANNTFFEVNYVYYTTDSAVRSIGWFNSIKGGTIYGCTNAGVDFSGGGNSTAKGITFYNNLVAGIRIRNGVDNVRGVSNDFRGNTLAFSIAANSEYTIVKDNCIDGTTYSDSGANTVYSDNIVNGVLVP